MGCSLNVTRLVANIAITFYITRSKIMIFGISARGRGGVGAEWVVMEAQPDELQLARLLESPEALENLPSIISDIKARKAASLAHLSDNMAGQVCASYRSG